jgi:hypothetical protein
MIPEWQAWRRLPGPEEDLPWSSFSGVEKPLIVLSGMTDPRLVE